MKIKELIEILQKEDPERLVVMSKDAEGNGYSPLEGYGTRRYIPNSTWSGETYIEGPLTDELIGQGYSEEDVTEEGERAFVLWPVN